MSEPVKDKFKAIWLSHSSIGDFLKCQRLYYLRNIYKDIRAGHKFTIVTPPLSLGQSVHEVIEGLSVLNTDERLKESLLDVFEKKWQKVRGEKGGFKSEDQEIEYKERGRRMLQNIMNNPGPILEKAVKIKSDNGLSSYWFSEEENLILCGKVDWIEYLEDNDSLHLIDFKTGRKTEDDDSLQLPIYLLLASNLQKRKIQKASYWYLEKDGKTHEITLPEINDSFEKILKIAQRIKLARQLNHFICKNGGCVHCNPFERVLRGEGKFVGLSEYKQDLYVLN